MIKKTYPFELIIATYNDVGFVPEDIINFETLLDIQIKVVCLERSNNVIHSGPDKDYIKFVKNRNHFDVINSMAGFYASSFFCETCNRPYDNKGKHACKVKRVTTCHNCYGSLHVNEESIKTYSNRCNIHFYY